MSMFYGGQKNLYPDLDDHKDNQENNKKQPQPPQDIFNKNKADGRASVFLDKDKEKDAQPEKEQGCFAKCCACCQLSYYKDYFKVTNKDVYSRILCNLKFWAGGFFTHPEQEYDLYGPFWLYTTMVFVVGAVSNILVYENQSDGFKYNFQIIGVALTVFYIMGLAGSAVIGLIFGCMGLQSKTSQIVCLYGYSMSIYIICVLLCSINMSLMTWLFLLYAAGTKVAYILKNVFQKLQVPASKKMVIILMVVIQAAIQLLVIKFAFIKTGGTQSSVFSHHMMAVPLHQSHEFLHLRQFSSTL